MEKRGRKDTLGREDSTNMMSKQKLVEARPTC